MIQAKCFLSSDIEPQWGKPVAPQITKEKKNFKPKNSACFCNLGSYWNTQREFTNTETSPSLHQMHRCPIDGSLTLWPGYTRPAVPRLNPRRRRNKADSQTAPQSPPDAELWSPAGSHRWRRNRARPCWSRGRKPLANKRTQCHYDTHKHKEHCHGFWEPCHLL